jgi:hypothetical protein
MLHAVLLAALLSSAPVRPAADSVRSDEDVRLVALRHASEIRQCYESHGLKVNPSLGGTLEVELLVLPTGRVDSAAVSRSQLAGPGKHEVEACVVGAVRNWRFDRGNYALEAIVYPFQLRRDESVRAASRT